MTVLRGKFIEAITGASFYFKTHKIDKDENDKLTYYQIEKIRIEAHEKYDNESHNTILNKFYRNKPVLFYVIERQSDNFLLVKSLRIIKEDEL